MKKNNKGFSLVELIIVIAIMAILVGIIAPQLLKYIEKSKVSTDLRSLDAIYQAVVYAANDPNVLLDQPSQDLINSLSTKTKLEDLAVGNTKYYQEILDLLDLQDLNQSTYEKFFTSSHDPNNLTIYVQYKGGVMNPMAMWATTTDVTGNRNTNYDPLDWTHLEDPNGRCIAIK
ncbi:MAG: prepilin-type N-terminal cleavage/methylation domain-containing protein [Lachnospiraceae bacterium]|nr:prepilin-type N-terminal cleavage/methylation domain-containing protein [Lachnospiraceae bacterium]